MTGGWRRGPSARVITRPGEEPGRTRHSMLHTFDKILKICHRIFPPGRADLLCCGAFAVYEYSFMRYAVHIDL
jgi:hypothetical protein